MRALHVLAFLAVLSPSVFAQDFRLENEKELARERAIIPYIEKARATYPAAKKRFLAGLPPGHVFAVMIRLRHIDKAKKEITVNDVFVRVHAIKKGKVMVVSTQFLSSCTRKAIQSLFPNQKLSIGRFSGLMGRKKATTLESSWTTTNRNRSNQAMERTADRHTLHF